MAIKIAVSIVSVDFDQQQEISHHSFVSTWKTDALKDRFEIFFITISSLIVVLGIAFITHVIDLFNPTIIKAKMPLKKTRSHLDQAYFHRDIQKIFANTFRPA